jgi:hypothetical protein
MDADKYNREKIVSDLTEIKSPHQKIEFLTNLKIDFLENTDPIYRLRDALQDSSKRSAIVWDYFDRWCDNKINDQIKILNTPSPKIANKGGISFNENDKIILIDTIKPLYDFCIEHDFFESDFEYPDFFNCFNLDKTITLYPKFKHPNQQWFTFLISELTDLNGRQVKERFNIASLSTILNRIENKSKSPNIKDKMKAFVNRYKP